MSIQNDIHELSRQLDEHYKEVEQRVEKLFVSPDLNTEKLGDVRTLLDKVREVEARLTPLRETCVAQGLPLLPETKQIFAGTAQLISQLIPRLGELEQAAAKAKDQLAPQVHAGVRALKMQTAYSRNLVTG